MEKYYSISPICEPGGIGSGFFSNYRICLEKLVDFHQMNRTENVYINWANTTFVDGFNPLVQYGKIIGGEMPIDDSNNPFNQWFEQENPYKLDVPIDNIILSDMRRSGHINHAEDYFDDPSLELQQFVDRKYIKIKDEIQQKVDSIYQEHFDGHTVLGVMLRGSEFNYHHGNIYGHQTIDSYISAIKKVLLGNPQITKLFIVSDETEYVNKTSDAFPSSYFIPNIFRRTDETDEYIIRVHCWMNVSKKRENHCKLLGEETIIQTKLLSKCDYLFGRHCGIIAGAVLWNENIKKVFRLSPTPNRKEHNFFNKIKMNKKIYSK
jgi:hypothetical protein